MGPEGGVSGPNFWSGDASFDVAERSSSRSRAVASGPVRLPCVLRQVRRKLVCLGLSPGPSSH